MSIIRDIRLVSAQHLSLPAETRHSFIELLHQLDMELDREGYEPGVEVKKALTKFETSLLDISDVVSTSNEEDIFLEEDVDFVDIEEIDLIDPSTEE